ncbi:MAG: TldD/PmbA family protein [Myxococcota bacterium]
MDHTIERYKQQLQHLTASLLPLCKQVDFVNVRFVRRYSEKLTMRKDLLQPPQTVVDSGAMVMLLHQGGIGYAATSTLQSAALQQTFLQAKQWAQLNSPQQWGGWDASHVRMPQPHGSYSSVVQQPWHDMPLTDKIDLLQQASRALHSDERIVDWEAGLWHTTIHELLWNCHNRQAQQIFVYTTPHLQAVAHHRGVTQERSLEAYRGYCFQGGLEVLQQCSFLQRAQQIGQDALQLVCAANCPSERMDLLLDSGQMVLQVHESIGHPLELDRILGDERNYAGGSFVTQEMFGNYQYGSKLLNITYDPTHPQQIATFAYDSEGCPAQKEWIIRQGMLQQPLGGALSNARCNRTNPIATTRACSWNRPPIDRMSNLNMQPGCSSFDDMVASIDKGVLMKTNKSWSIDQMRNKFQFGCEWGQLIENGKLTQVVRNPCYRGLSATFWRNLKQVGNASSYNMLGSPYCGKGEPNQCIHVGHATPAAHFADVEIFGGA